MQEAETMGAVLKKHGWDLIFIGALFAFLCGSFIYFHQAPLRENEPGTINEMQIPLKDFFLESQGLTSSLAPLHYTVAKLMPFFSYKDLRFISTLSLAGLVLLFFFYIRARISVLYGVAFGALILLNTQLFYYGMLFRFWELSFFLLAAGLCLYFAIRNHLLSERYLPAVWILLSLSCFTNFSMYLPFFLVQAVERKKIFRMGHGKIINAATMVVALAFFLLRVPAVLRVRFEERVLIRPDFFVFRWSHLRYFLTGYVTPQAWIGSVLFGTFALGTAYFVWRNADSRRSAKYLIVGAFASWFLFFVLSCLPLQEIDVRYSAWVLFIFILCAAEVIRCASKFQRFFFNALLGTILIWEAASLSWYFQEYKSVEIPWEQISGQILNNRPQVQGFCVNPSFHFDFIKYSSPQEFWPEMDRLHFKGCEMESVREYFVEVLLQKPNLEGASVVRIPLKEGYELRDDILKSPF